MKQRAWILPIAIVVMLVLIGGVSAWHVNGSTGRPNWALRVVADLSYMVGWETDWAMTIRLREVKHQIDEIWSRPVPATPPYDYPLIAEQDDPQVAAPPCQK